MKPRDQPHPKLRRLDRYPLQRDGEELLVLSDPFALDPPLAVDPTLAPYLELMDGSRSVAQIRQSLLMRGHPVVEFGELEDVVQTLDGCGFLDDERFRQRWASALAEFSDCTELSCTLDDIAYPSDRAQLHALLRAQLEVETQSEHSRIGLVMPHAPLADESPAQMRALWSCLPSADALDGILLLCTAHNPGRTPYQVWAKDFKTPLGSIRGARDLANAISRGREWLFQEPMRWRGEIALELPLLRLRARYPKQCPPVLAVLCGRSSLDESELQNDESLSEGRIGFLAALESLVRHQRWLVIACGELSHTGEGYGQQSTPEIDASVESYDRKLVTAIRERQTLAFEASRLLTYPSYQRPSGAACMATFLQILPPEWSSTYSQYIRAPAPDEAGRAGRCYVRFEG